MLPPIRMIFHSMQYKRACTHIRAFSEYNMQEINYGITYPCTIINILFYRSLTTWEDNRRKHRFLSSNTSEIHNSLTRV